MIPNSQFLSLDSLSDESIALLLKRASEVKAEPIRNVLSGKVIGLLFMNPSLRTLASFQAGAAQLGGASFVITPGSGTWKLETRPGVVMDGAGVEHIKEAVPVLEQYCDVLGVRCFAEGTNLKEDLRDPILNAFADMASKPLINMESATDHPCQALADWQTLNELDVPTSGGRFVLSWAYHPKALPIAVPAAAAAMAARRGMDVTIACPTGFELPDHLMDRVRRQAEKSGGSVSETNNYEEAMSGAHVLYAKSWQAPSQYGNSDAEHSLRNANRHWTVQPDWFNNAEDDAHFMHCLPVRRNVIVADSVLDGPRSRVIQQAGNRLHAQKALLWTLLEN